MKSRLFAIIMILIHGSHVLAVANPPTDSLDIFLKKKMKELKIPGLQIAVVQNGKIIRLGSYGVASIEFSVPMTNSIIMPVNSMTKAFTGIAVMQLVETGKMNLDSPISFYLDSLPLGWSKITVRQIMTHMSGIPDIVDGNLDLISPEGEEASFKKAMSLPMDFKPGEKFAYNQMNYAIIGKIISKLMDKPFTRVITEKQFQPAGMKSTGYYDSRDVVKNMGRTYAYLIYANGDYQLTDHINTRYEVIPPIIRTAAGIYSNAEDLAHWIIAIQEGKFLKKTSLKTLWTPGRLNNDSTAGFSDLINGYAIGWPIAVRKKHPAVTPVGGERSAMFYYPQDDLTIIILTNLMGASPQQLMDPIAAFHFKK
jgi:CubicO group peptidase (beta-lactamase class C family)